MHLPQPSAPLRRALEVLIVLIALVLAALSLRTPTPPSQAAGGLTPAVLTPDAPDKDVLVVSGGALTAAMVKKAADAIDWGSDVAVHEGAGISRAPRGDKPLAVAVRTDAADTKADMVVVQGGEFDGAAADRELEVAIYHLIDWVVAYQPKGSIFVLAGPIPQEAGAPSADLVRANHLMRLTAARRGVRYIDAIELGWSTSKDLSRSLGDQLVVAARPRVFPSRRPEPTASATSKTKDERTAHPAPSAAAAESPSDEPAGRPQGGLAASSPSPRPAASAATSASPNPSAVRSPVPSPSPSPSGRPSPSPKSSPSPKPSPSPH